MAGDRVKMEVLGRVSSEPAEGERRKTGVTQQRLISVLFAPSHDQLGMAASFGVLWQICRFQYGNML